MSSVFQYSLRIVGFCDEPGWEDIDVTSLVLSVFPANRGVLRHIPVADLENAGGDFQYSLRIVGFCDLWRGGLDGTVYAPFSIPCESWGSATTRVYSARV